MENRHKLRRVSHFEEYGLRDQEHATAIAAAAFAIYSVEEEAESLNNAHKVREGPTKCSRKTMSRKEDGLLSRRPSYGGDNGFGVRRQSGNIASSPLPIIQHKNVKTRADAWEKARMEKIHNWYEKIKSKILSWENEEKMQAKLHLERKSLQEHKRPIELQNFQNKIARTEMIAQAAIAELEVKRRKEESEVREKANKFRRTGRLPIKCFCCFIF